MRFLSRDQINQIEYTSIRNKGSACQISMTNIRKTQISRLILQGNVSILRMLNIKTQEFQTMRENQNLIIPSAFSHICRNNLALLRDLHKQHLQKIPLKSLAETNLKTNCLRNLENIWTLTRRVGCTSCSKIKRLIKLSSMLSLCPQNKRILLKTSTMFSFKRIILSRSIMQTQLRMKFWMLLTKPQIYRFSALKMSQFKINSQLKSLKNLVKADKQRFIRLKFSKSQAYCSLTKQGR